jgi:hypothetical protein
MSNGRGDEPPHPADDPAELARHDQGHRPAVTAWEDPVPLAGQASALPKFPLTALPRWMADMVRAIARFHDTPPDVAAFASLGVVSVATGRRAWVNVKGQREAVNAYLLTALDSGQRKSGPFGSLATGPILEAQRRLQADEDAKAEDRGEEPVPIRLFTTNATPAGLRELAAASGERIGIVSAEGGIFEELAGRYDRVPDLDLVLAGWNGEPYAADRATKPVPPMHCPVLTFCLTAQPAVLRELAHKPSFRDRGLLARFLYGLPADVVGKRRNERLAVPDEVREAYQGNMAALIAGLYHTDRLEWSLGEAAYQLFHDAEQEIEPKLARGGEYGGNDGMREWASKYMGQVLKLAGLLHAAGHAPDNHPGRISEQTMRNALRLGEYFLAHAEAAFGLMRTDPLAQDAEAVLDWVRAIDWTGKTGGKLGASIAGHPGSLHAARFRRACGRSSPPTKPRR